MAAAPDRLLLGTHVSIAGGLEKAFVRAAAIGCTAMQIFTRNANRWQAPVLEEKTIAAFHAARTDSGVRYVAAHSSYLINLASPDEQQRRRSLDLCVDELSRCRLLGIEALVMHPGAHKGAGVDTGLTILVQSLTELCTRTPRGVIVLLENTAGQGTSLGARIEELAEILKRVDPERFGLCLDTCHAYAAGYDLGRPQGYDQLMAAIERLIGIKKLELFHLNDSKKALGSRVDRHEHVGQGLIGAAGFLRLLQDERFYDCAKVIETPPGEENCHDLENLALLRKLAQRS